MVSTRSENYSNQPAADRIFTVSNLISVARIPIAVAIIYVHWANSQQINGLVGVLIAAGVISDYLDGFLARRFNQVSELGKALDPICDKIAMAMLFLYVVWLGHIPVWFLGFMVVRDVVIALGSLWVKNRTNTMPMAINSGKLSLNAVVLYWVVAFGWPGANTALEITQGLALFVMMYSWGDYFYRFYHIAQSG